MGNNIDFLLVQKLIHPHKAFVNFVEDGTLKNQLGIDTENQYTLYDKKNYTSLSHNQHQ